MSAALGITPPDNNKFLAVEALGFQLRAPVRFIPAIDGAFANLVIGISERVRRNGQQGFQPGFAIYQRQGGQILPVQEQQIEQEEDHRNPLRYYWRSGSG
jgi:hypothetical protein